MSNTEKIAQINDEFRRSLDQPNRSIPGKVLITIGIKERILPVDPLGLFHNVKHFEEFNADNDPHGEHDFGAFKLAGEKIFWKIDYYDTSYRYGSEDPTDLEQTRRVLTIMLAEEY